jgi:hypothetical protein
MFRRFALIATIVPALLTAACGAAEESGLQAVRDDQRMMFFEVPSEWTVLQELDLTGVIDTPFVSQSDIILPVLSRVVFEAGVGTELVTNPAAASVPIGSAVVRSISSSARDVMSRVLLAEAVFPLRQQETAEVLSKSDISLGDGFDGVQLVVRYTDAVRDQDAVVAILAVTDPEVTRMYSFAVGCTIDCFVDHQQEILDAMDSWLVDTR